MINPWTPIWKDNTESWSVDFRIGKRRFRRRLPVRGKEQRSLAERMARELYKSAWEEDLRSGQSHNKTSFVKAAELYQNSGGETRFLPKLSRYFGHEIAIEEIDEIKISQAARALYPNASPETIRRQVRVPIRAIQNFAAGKRRERSSDNRRLRWLTPEEAETMLLAASDPEAIGLRDPRRETLRKIAFMLGTGAGPRETMSLDGRDWNPITREWWLSGTKTAFRPRFVVLPQRVIEIVGQIPAQGCAFPAPDGHPYKLPPQSRRTDGGGLQ